MRKVRFFGQGKSASGYGNAIRNFAKAFEISGVPTVFATKDLGVGYSYNGNTDTDFYIHGPPYSLHKGNNYKIGYFYWETTKLHPRWVAELKYLNEIWAPCELVRKAVIESGYKGKVSIVPTPIKLFDKNLKIKIPNENKNTDELFKFYSIFQWHKRKGYENLLKGYISEFSAEDNVLLILKVNPIGYKNMTSAAIKKDILKIKSYVNKENPPPIFLSEKILPESYIYSLHNSADCYVAPHYGEGWGMPIHDAMYAGKSIITTKFGGVTEFLDDNSAHIIPHKLVPVTNMDWSPWYQKDQMWAEPSLQKLKSIMRDVYENKDFYLDKKNKASSIAETMSIENVSKIIKEKLK